MVAPLWISAALILAQDREPGPEPTAEPAVAEVPRGLVRSHGLAPFYRRHLDVDGLPLLSSERVPDEAFLAARELLQRMLAKDPRLAKELAKSKVRVAIMAPDEVTTDVPEHADLNRHFDRTGQGTDWNQRARGLGATRARPACSVGAENLLGLPGDRYRGESILIHEFAHTLHLLAISKLDRGFQRELEAAFRAARDKGLWENTYAATNVQEYWAEGVQSWFDANLEAEPPNGIHNHVDTRAELWSYDPRLARLIAAWMVDDQWRFQDPAQPEAEAATEGAEPPRAGDG